MIKKICKVCGKKFFVKNYRKNTAKFCSNKCFWSSPEVKKMGQSNKKKKIIKICLYCKKEFEVYLCQKDNKKFCSSKCHYQFRKGKPNSSKGIKRPQFSGKNSPSWKGGKLKTKSGRWRITINSMMRIFQSRWIAESCLERPLIKNECIHHINEDKSDDRPENLYLFITNSEHIKYHKNSYPLMSNLL